LIRLKELRRHSRRLVWQDSRDTGKRREAIFYDFWKCCFPLYKACTAILPQSQYIPMVSSGKLCEKKGFDNGVEYANNSIEEVTAQSLGENKES